MQKILTLAAAIIVFAGAQAAALDEIQFLPTRTKLDSDKNRAGSDTTVETKEIAYTVKVTSRSFKELLDVTVKYNVFYEDSQLGSTAEPEIKCSAGSHVFPSLLTNKPVEFATETIKLDKASLDPGWYFASGASSKAKDKVVGLWFKAFDSSGKQIGEYANPTTVAKKRKWKD